jgi:hypothetical protein
MLVAVFSASAALAEAQAVARGSGGGGSSSPSSSGSSSSSGGGGGSTTSSSSGGGSGFSEPSAPQHSYAPPRTPSHASGGSSGGSSSGSGRSGGTAGRRADGGSTSSATAPTYARPEGSTGYSGAYAIPRQRTPGGGGRPPIYAYSPYYSLYPWGFGFFGYGYGLDYFYNPFYYGGLGYPGYGYYGSPYGYGYPGGYGYYGAGGYDSWGDTNSSTYESNESAREREQEGPTGELRIKVKPREAKVIVDGQVMGVVDDFDGMFQKLALTEGHHQISLQLEGYQTQTFDIVIIAGQTVNYKGDLHKLADIQKR